MARGFRIDGHFIPISFDTNGDSKLQVSELSIWCKANDFKYENGEIIAAIPYDAKHAPTTIDVNKYSFESIKKRYPADKYSVFQSVSNGCIFVWNINTKNLVLVVSSTKNEGVKIFHYSGNDVTAAYYDQFGQLNFADSWLGGEKQVNNLSCNKIHEDICAKNRFGFPTTGADLGKHINSINAENVDLLLKNYQDEYGKSLISDIWEEVGLDAETRGNYAKHIVDALYNQNVLCCSNEELNFFNDLKSQCYEAIDNEVNSWSRMCSSRIDELISRFKFNESLIISAQIRDDIREKTSFGLPTTGKNLGNHIRQITPDNIESVMSYYEEHNGATLIEDIIEERGLSTNTRKIYICHIINNYIKYAENEGVNVSDLVTIFNDEIKYQLDKSCFADADYLNVYMKQIDDRISTVMSHMDTEITQPNGKIDTDFKQGHTGDCWLLASIKAIANKPKGLQILNDSIKVNDDNSVTVTLRGVNKTYTIPQEELNNSIQLSCGDGDVRALEIAVNKYFREERGVNESLDINGNFMTVAYQILVGDENIDDGRRSFVCQIISGFEYYKEIDDDLIRTFNDPNKVITVAANGKSDYAFNNDTDNNNSQVLLYSNHAYAVQSADENNVYIVNPHDTSKVLTIPMDKFKNFFDEYNSLDLQ